jgi:hypothetical protein
VVPIVDRTVVRRPVVAEHVAVPGVDGQARREPSVERPGPPVVQPERRAPLVGTTAAAPHPAPIDNLRTTDTVSHRAANRPAETAVTYPTGIVVQNERGIYRPDRPLRIEEYLRFPEPQLDANGEETWTPLYHAKAAR